MDKEKQYYKKIDYLRIISCILVFLYHLSIVKGGFLAVCTFFALSGYLSCMSALKQEEFSVKKYYKNRLKKIYLPLIIVVFCTVMIAKIHSNIRWINLKKESLSVLFGYNNFWQLHANLDYFTKNINSPFIHFWYISILMQYELVFPIAFYALKNINNKVKKHISTVIVFLLLIVSTILFYVMSKKEDIMQVYYNSFARCFSFIFGVLLAIIHNTYNFKLAKPFKKYKEPIFIIYCAVLVILCIFISAKSNEYAIYMILTTIITIRLIEYASIEIKKHEKQNTIAKLLANCTYEIYLVQYPVIFFIQNSSINNKVQTILIIILTLIIAYILNLSMNLKTNNKPIKVFTKLIIIAIITSGNVFIIKEKDHSIEMKELENRLNENAKIIEEKNNEYVATSTVEEISNNTLANDGEILNNTIAVEEEISNNKEDAKQVTLEPNLENAKINKESVENIVRNLKVVGIGDSVLLGAINEFYKQFPNGYFDGKVSRTITKAKDLLLDLKKQGKLPNTLILSLANNGDYSNKLNKNFIESLGTREIYWVNAVGADDPKFNEKFEKFAVEYKNIHIVKWDKVSKNHPEYFYADGIHLKGPGIKEYVNTIYQAIYNNYLEKNSNN